MNKTLTKTIVALYGVKSPEGVLTSREEVLAGHVLPPPYVIKPNDEGSSVGVRIVDIGSCLAPEEWCYGDTALVETYIPGRELTVGVLSNPSLSARALEVTEIIPEVGFYDYEAKYASGGSRHVVPADVPEIVRDLAMSQAIAVHNALGCQGVSRSDFRYDDTQPGIDGLYFLEINTQPGMTETSLVPEQCAAVGMSFDELVQLIVEAAL
jgi:D-alanine-D-alanine ligase